MPRWTSEVSSCPGSRLEACVVPRRCSKSPVSSGSEFLGFCLPRREALSVGGLGPDVDKLDKTSLVSRLVAQQLAQEKKKEAELEEQWVGGHNPRAPDVVKVSVTQ